VNKGKEIRKPRFIQNTSDRGKKEAEVGVFTTRMGGF